MSERPPTRSIVEAQAVVWLLRVESPAADEADWMALQAWLDLSPANRLAFERAELLSAELAELEPARPAIVQAFVLPGRRRLALWLVPALAACLMVAAFVGVMSRPAPWRTYETAKGQDRQFTLEDGSRIHLNSGSKLAVRMGRRVREVRVDDAEAAFDVAHDSNRPFVVQGGDWRVRVVGTEFNVLKAKTVFQVTVRRGLVDVAQGEDPPQAGRFRLAVGDQLTQRTGQGATVAHVDPEVAFAWRSRNRVYSETPLADVVADLNRYFMVPIALDPAANRLRLSGVLTIDTEAAVVQRLEAFLPLRASRQPQGILLALEEKPQ